MDDDDEEEMKGRGGDAEEIQDSRLVEEGMMVKFPLVPLATFAAPASRFFPQEEVKQLHRRDSQKPQYHVLSATCNPALFARTV